MFEPLGNLRSGYTGEKRKSWKAMMDLSRDPRECIFSYLGLIVSWLLAVAQGHNQGL